MKKILMLFICFLVISLSRAGSVVVYPGMCDASATEYLDSVHFVVASDEDNILRIFEVGKGVKALRDIDLNVFLDTKKNQEADLEGAAKIGNRIYWISSHGANKNGKHRPSRRRFFATDIQLAPVGIPYSDLIEDMGRYPDYRNLKLGEATQLAPESPGGLNIEGLAENPAGGLYIGFRNPIPQGKALLAPLLNPEGVIAGKKAKFGAPIMLSLGGLGVRSLEYSGARKEFLIVAGRPDSQNEFKLFTWSGKISDAPKHLYSVVFGDLYPEAMAWDPSHVNRLLVLSDDGGACQDEDSPARKSEFRGMVVDFDKFGKR